MLAALQDTLSHLERADCLGGLVDKLERAFTATAPAIARARRMAAALSTQDAFARWAY